MVCWLLRGAILGVLTFSVYLFFGGTAPPARAHDNCATDYLYGTDPTALRTGVTLTCCTIGGAKYPRVTIRVTGTGSYQRSTDGKLSVAPTVPGMLISIHRQALTST